MRMPPTRPAKSAEQPNILNEADEKEVRRILRVARMARGRFHLFPVESNIPVSLRNQVFDRLRDELAANGQRLRSVTLDRSCWDIFDVLGCESPVERNDVLIVVGLEKTPHIIMEPGAEPKRPPALAVLNQMRECIHAQVPAPLFVWCPTYTYNAMIEHAPDFFDQYTSQFHIGGNSFLPGSSLKGIIQRQFENMSVIVSAPGSQTAIDFFRKQVSANPDPTWERAKALFSLAMELYKNSAFRNSSVNSQALEFVEEASRLMGRQRKRGYRTGWAIMKLGLGLSYGIAFNGQYSSYLRKALACFKAALRVFTECNSPDLWADTQAGMGFAYLHLSEHARAMECFSTALRVYNVTTSPAKWADAQYKIGICYRKLLVGDQIINQQSAISHFEDALRIFTELEHTKQWADTMYELGLTYHEKLSGDTTENKMRAIACLEAAERGYVAIYQTKSLPCIQFMIALIASSLMIDFDVEKTLQRFEKAARSFRAINDEDQALEVESRLRAYLELVSDQRVISYLKTTKVQSTTHED